MFILVFVTIIVCSIYLYVLNKYEPKFINVFTFEKSIFLSLIFIAILMYFIMCTLKQGLLWQGLY